MCGVPFVLRGKFQHTAARRRLPDCKISASVITLRFNTQPPEGGCNDQIADTYDLQNVSTHSRPKAAATPWAGC